MNAGLHWLRMTGDDGWRRMCGKLWDKLEESLIFHRVEHVVHKLVSMQIWYNFIVVIWLDPYLNIYREISTSLIWVTKILTHNINC